jgi:hypothetical protein
MTFYPLTVVLRNVAVDSDSDIDDEILADYMQV